MYIHTRALTHARARARTHTHTQTYPSTPRVKILQHSKGWLSNGAVDMEEVLSVCFVVKRGLLQGEGDGEAEGSGQGRGSGRASGGSPWKTSYAEFKVQTPI